MWAYKSGLELVQLTRLSVTITSATFLGLAFFITLSSFFIPQAHAEAVFKNPGIPESETIELSDRIDQRIGYVLTRVRISVQQENEKKIYLIQAAEGIDKHFTNNDTNIYSRYAYFLSFEGFPFEIGKSVSFSSYVSEYGDALPMKLSCIAKESVTVKAGTFECYKLELSVGGWQSLFSSDKYYLYYAVEKPHRFVKYEEKDKDGKWYANEFIRVIR